MKNYEFQYFRLFVIYNNINKILSTYIDLFSFFILFSKNYSILKNI